MTSTHDSRNFFLEGPAGRLEAILWTPSAAAHPPLAAVVCHPHPLFGGTMHNKVVYQTAKSLDALAIPVLRFNFRGAGTSAGVHSRGFGELGDVRAALDFLAASFLVRRCCSRDSVSVPGLACASAAKTRASRT